MSISPERDVVVVGKSIAGVAAALTLSRSHKVGIVDYPYDNVPLGDAFLIGPTPLSGAPLSGVEFEMLADRAMEDAEIEKLDYSLATPFFPDRVTVDAINRQIQIEDTMNKSRVKCNAIVFAPQGTQYYRTLPFDISTLKGKSCSMSAWSDGPYFRNKSVAVYGSGYYAMQQALILESMGCSVSILITGSEIPNRNNEIIRRLLYHVSVSKHINVNIGSTVLSIDAPGGFLKHVEVFQSKASKLIKADALFVANDPTADWTLWGEGSQVEQIKSEMHFRPAGIANGFLPLDHDEIFNDGVISAQSLLKCLRQS